MLTCLGSESDGVAAITDKLLAGALLAQVSEVFVLFSKYLVASAAATKLWPHALSHMLFRVIDVESSSAVSTSQFNLVVLLLVKRVHLGCLFEFFAWVLLAALGIRTSVVIFEG